VLYFFFGYQKWFDYEAQGLIPFFTHKPLIFWMYSVFGIKGSTYLLGVSEWLFGALLLGGFWNRKLGILGTLGSVVTFISTVTITPFMPDGWAPSAGGFPAMIGNVAFFVKDVVLLAVSSYLLTQDLVRASAPITVSTKQETVVCQLNSLHKDRRGRTPSFDCGNSGKGLLSLPAGTNLGANDV
jgi:uncharacterized membrane protein YkgB